MVETPPREPPRQQTQTAMLNTDPPRRAALPCASCRSSARRSGRHAAFRASSAPRPARTGLRSRARTTAPAHYILKGYLSAFSDERQGHRRLCLGRSRQWRRPLAPHPGTGKRALGSAGSLGRRSRLGHAANRLENHHRILVLAATLVAVKPQAFRNIKRA